MKSKEAAVVAFVISLFSLLPLFNFFLAPLSVYLGVKALKNINKHPNTYYGKSYALSAIILGSWIIVFSVFYLIFVINQGGVQHLCSMLLA